MIFGQELVRKVGECATRLEYMFEGTKDSVAVKGELLEDSLSTELSLVVGIASVKLDGQLGTVVGVRVSGSPDGAAPRRLALISLETITLAVTQAA